MALSFDAWKPGAVQPATVDVPVHIIEAVESAQLRATWKGHEDFVWQVAWAPDGKTLATLSSVKGEVKLWDVAERKERATLRGDLGDSYSLAFTPDGNTLVVGHYKNDAKVGSTGGIALWDVATGQRKGVLRHTPPRGVSRLVLVPDRKLIAASESWTVACRVAGFGTERGRPAASLAAPRNTLPAADARCGAWLDERLECPPP